MCSSDLKPNSVLPADKTEFGFWETPRGNPIALRSWFPKGEVYGQEFVYPKGLATKIAEETGQPVLVTRAETEVELETAPVTEVNAAGEEQPVEVAMAAPPPVPPPEAFAAPAPEPAPQAPREPVELPATASPFFNIGLLGALLAAAGFTLRKAVLNKS